MKLICWLVAAMATAVLVVFAQPQCAPPQSTDIDADASCPLFDRERDAVFARILEKDRIAQALLRGELTLDQAANGFRTLIGGDAKVIEFLQGWYAATGDEIYYRNVVTFAKSIAQEEPESVAAVARALQEEVDRRFRSKISTE